MQLDLTCLDGEAARRLVNCINATTAYSASGVIGRNQDGSTKYMARIQQEPISRPKTSGR